MKITAKPLRWRKPSDHPQDMEDAAFVANGIGGRYAVTDDGLLWWAHDEFTFEQFASIDAAKDAAEADWQRRIRLVVCIQQTDAGEG